MKIQESIEITAPADRIWPYLATPSKVLKWASSFKRFEFENGETSGLDARLYLEEQPGSGPFMRLHTVITEWVEGERLSTRMVSGDGAAAHALTWSIKPVPMGSIVTYREDVQLKGLLGRLLELVCKGRCAVQVRLMLHRLKDLTEI